MELSNKQSQNLLLVLLTCETAVHAIDEVEKLKEGWQRDVKAQAGKLRNTIITKHGKHLGALYDANEGEFIANVSPVISNTLSNMVKMGIIQWGAMEQLSNMLLENPHMTLEGDEKDKLIELMRSELEGAAKGLKEAHDMVDKLHTKLSHMTAIGRQPYHVISSELIEIKRKLRFISQGNEVAKNENQPRS